MQHAWKIYQTNDYKTFSLLFGSLQHSTIELRNAQKILILKPRGKGTHVSVNVNGFTSPAPSRAIKRMGLSGTP
jgi:hypothetical protein